MVKPDFKSLILPAFTLGLPVNVSKIYKEVRLIVLEEIEILKIML